MNKWIKNSIALGLGIVFGFALTRTEATSFDRLHAMFQFQEFHMFGIIGSAVVVAAICLRLIQWFHLRTVDGREIHVPVKKLHTGTWAGAILFGLGWGLTGSCPGTVMAQIGQGRFAGWFTMAGMIVGVILLNWAYPRLRHLMKE